MIQQKKYFVLFEYNAIAYEDAGKRADHVRDGAGNYQAMAIFWRMLFPRKGSFVYWSHRIIKWLVPINLIFLIIVSFALSFCSCVMAAVFCVQVLGYVALLLYYLVYARHNRKFEGIIGKLLALIEYFVALNFVWLRGLLALITKKN